MGALWSELGKKIAERWLSLLVLPGALYLAVVAAGTSLGHGHALDAARLIRRVDDYAQSPAVGTLGGQVILLVSVLAASAAVGLGAQGMGSLVERVVLAADWQTWVPPGRAAAAWLVSVRRDRWTRAARVYLDLRVAAARSRALGTRADPAPREAAYRAMARIGQEYPQRPTWSGDRVHAVTARLERDHHLSLATVWPYLWLTLPEPTRAEVTLARGALSRAAALLGWSLLYLILALWWWPAALIGCVLAVVGRARVRNCADSYALLLEAVARLHSAELAAALGLGRPGQEPPDGSVPPGPLSRETAEALTLLLGGSPPPVP
ncbi:hypothetical protein [Streptomyces sp. NPDC005989]|uniref:hypothetical protein n=1 Tax=Streptomyces sp. NPDC005989 TaxID=3156727 RepID=UPI0033F9AC85